MQILIQYPMGVAIEALVLSMEPNRLRVTAPGFEDALELIHSGSGWATEQGQEIGLGFLQYGAVEAASIFPPELALTAGASPSCGMEG